jgi:hypothetical protein
MKANWNYFRLNVFDHLGLLYFEPLGHLDQFEMQLHRGKSLICKDSELFVFVQLI